MEIWVDGILKGTNPHTGGLPNPNYATVLIGTDSWRSDTHGLIGSVVIWDDQRSLSDGDFDRSEEVGLVEGRPKCADFDCREVHHARASTFYPGRWSIIPISGPAPLIGTQQDAS